MRWTGWLVGIWMAMAGIATARTWTWVGGCSSNGWYDVCNIGSCGSGILQYTNNWGDTTCGVTPSFPEPGDTVLIPTGATANLNGDAQVGRLVVYEGATLTVSTGTLEISGSLENHGTLEMLYSSSHTILYLNPQARLLNSGTLSLNAYAEITGDSSAFLLNFGTLQKVNYADAEIRNIQIPHPGTLEILEGSLILLHTRLQDTLSISGPGSLALKGVLFSDTSWILGTHASILDTLFSADSSPLSFDLDTLYWDAVPISLAPQASLRNLGTLLLSSDVHPFSGTLENLGTLLLPYYSTHASLYLNPQARLLNSGTLSLNAYAEITGDSSASLLNFCTLQKMNYADAEIRNIQIAQQGTLVVWEGGLRLEAASFQQQAGETRVLGTLQAQQPLAFVHGSLLGTGTVAAPTTFQGDTLSPGNGPQGTGTLTWSGAGLVMDSGAVYRIDLGLTTDSSLVYDRLVVNGTSGDSLVLDHPVWVAVLGYTPSATEDSVPVLSWSSSTVFSGEPDTLILVNAPAGTHAWITVNMSNHTAYLHLVNRPGDVNDDGEVNMLDLEYLAQYLYFHGPAPPVPAFADLNGDTQVNDLDLVALSRKLQAE